MDTYNKNGPSTSKTSTDDEMNGRKDEEKEYRPFTLKRWNACALWAWDVECDTCAICRVQLMEDCLKCQTEGGGGAVPVSAASSSGDGKKESTPTGARECVVVWGECSHAFHNCCMAAWVKQNARCPLCQQSWVVSRIGE